MKLFARIFSIAPLVLIALTSQAVAGLTDISEVNLIPAVYFDPSEYLVNPGDEIWISFPGGIPFAGTDETVSVLLLPVALDGVLSIPTMPGIDTDGITLQALQNTISRLFAGSYGGMNVSSGLSRSAGFQIPVTGQVVRPGMIGVNGLSRLTAALGNAGGVTATGASSAVIVINSSGDSIVVDLNDFSVNGNIDSNPLTQRNTRIHVPVAAATIVIEGTFSTLYERTEEGMPFANRLQIEFIPGESAREAIARAGGASRATDLDRCFVYRATPDSLPVTIPFSLQGTTVPVILEPGDRLILPSAAGFINVTGEVIAAAPVLYSPGMSVNYYIGMAGGFNSLARRNSIRLILSDGEESSAEITTVVPLGATVEVPRVPVKFWEEYLTILTGVATVVIAYQSIFN